MKSVMVMDILYRENIRISEVQTILTDKRKNTEYFTI